MQVVLVSGGLDSARLRALAAGLGNLHHQLGPRGALLDRYGGIFVFGLKGINLNSVQKWIRFAWKD